MGIFKSFAEKLKNTGNRWTQSVSNLFSDDPVTDDFWDELEENLILGDVGIDTTETLIADLKQVMVDRRITNKRELKAAFAELLISRLEAVPGMGKPLDLSLKPSVVIMIGVNGSGKTTTSGKLASQLKAQGRHVIMAAADTFRAAAVEQLQSWADKLGIPIYKGAPNQDPASVCYEAHTQAIREGFQYLICDTAGRLHTRHNLMEELSKIRRTLAKQDAAAPHRTLLVVDATTGANALAQAREFHKATPLDSVIITKMDGSGKGGVAVAIMDEMHISPAFLGTGEGAEDFEPFNRDRYVDSLL